MDNKNKKQVIIGVTALLLVTLTLLGLTYAYYRTRIIGNTNEKSVSVTSKKLEVTYQNESAVIEPTEKIEPGYTASKTFEVKNTGSESVSYGIILDNITNTFKRTEDWIYTLTNTRTNEEYTGIIPTRDRYIVYSVTIGANITDTYRLDIEYVNSEEDQSEDMGKSLSLRINIGDSLENPYSEGTLAYSVINNAMIVSTGTVLRSEPERKVAEEISWGPIFTGRMKIEQKLDMSSQSQWYYGSTYKGAQPWNGGSYEGSTSTCTDTIVGKYISYPTVSESWYVKSCKSSTVAIVAGNEYEKSLSIAPDDYGDSYYYRGNVEDNYVTFAGMCWRIVRINGDGSTKLILEDQDEVCSASMNGNWDIGNGNFGYTYYDYNTLTASDGTKNSNTRHLMDYLHGETYSASSMATAFKNFQSTFTETELSKLKAGNWCLGDNAYDYSNNLLNSTQTMDNKIKDRLFYYDSEQRLYKNNPKQPTLKCNGTIMNDWDDAETNPTPMYVGAITADEIVYAGGKYYTSNQNYYLINNYKKTTAQHFWSLSPSHFNGNYDYAFHVRNIGDLYYNSVNSDSAFRPSVSLASSAVISSGEGTLDAPYVIG